MPGRRGFELFDYCSISVGMALACSGYAMLGQLFGLSSGGAPLVLGVIAAGLLCVLLSLSIAELAGMFPSSPGVRTYLKAAFGDRASHAITLLVLAMVMLFAGVESYYCTQALREELPGVSPYLMVTLIIGSSVALNLLGLELPRRVNLAMVVGALLLLGGISLAALLSDGAAAAPSAPIRDTGGGVRFAATVGAAVFVYAGFEWVTPLGRSPAAYRRLVPWSMPLALAVLIALFALVAAALDRQFSAAAMREDIAPHLRLGARVAPGWGVGAMLFVSVFSMFSTFNAGLMGSARLVYALSRERRFPRWGARLSPSGIPFGGVLFIGGASWLAALGVLRFSLFQPVSLLCAAIYCILYSMFALGALRLRRLRPGAERPFRSRVPVPVQWLVAAAMAALGVTVLLSDPALRGATATGFAAAVTACVVASHLLRPGAAARPPRLLSDKDAAER